MCIRDRDELWTSLQEFFRVKLRIPSTEIRQSEIADVRRRRQGKRSPAQKVLVVFVDTETRDRVQSYAKNLASYIVNGKPTATVRPDVPMHLGGVHKTLLQYGHALKGRYGAGFRRNIRFEDAEHTFCIDVCLKNGGDWITISYERALEDRKQSNVNKELAHGNLLSSNAGSGQAEPVEEDVPETPPWGSKK